MSSEAGAERDGEGEVGGESEMAEPATVGWSPTRSLGTGWQRLEEGYGEKLNVSSGVEYDTWRNVSACPGLAVGSGSSLKSNDRSRSRDGSV